MTTRGTAAPDAPTRAPGLVRRYRGAVVIGLALVAAVAVAALAGTGPTTTTPLDPDNPGPKGARALARVLADEGVRIDVARSADQLEQLSIDERTTVLVVDTDNLGTSTIERLLEQTGTSRLVVAGAGPGTTDALGSGRLPSQETAGDGLAARCDDPLFRDLTLEVDTAYAYPGPGCFRTGAGGAALAQARPERVLLGADEALTNDQVLRADNAAIALRLLGQDEHLVWYVASLDDLVGDDGVSLRTLLPRWIRPGLWLGGLVLVALVLWRGRRLGPLATEPIPVVVRAIETTRSRGRLYRRSGDRRHAAESLRRASRHRCADRLRLGPNPDTASVVRAVAGQVGRPEAEVAALLHPDPVAPATDKDLIVLARALADLDREVRRT